MRRYYTAIENSHCNCDCEHCRQVDAGDVVATARTMDALTNRLARYYGTLEAVGAGGMEMDGATHVETFRAGTVCGPIEIWEGRATTLAV